MGVIRRRKWLVKKRLPALAPEALATSRFNWLRGLDLNQRPSGYEPDELPGCSTPRRHLIGIAEVRQTNGAAGKNVHREKLPGTIGSVIEG
jgi:hypothetical protein